MARFSIHLPDSLKTILDVEACAQNRSRSGQIAFALRRWLRAEGKLPASHAGPPREHP